MPKRKREFEFVNGASPVGVSDAHCAWTQRGLRLVSGMHDDDGILVGDCFHCGEKAAPIEEFAPVESNKNARTRPAFLAACEAYDMARDDVARAAARADVEALRHLYCPSCAEKDRKRSPNVQACKDEYVRMRKAACAAQNGCRYPNCVERGSQAWSVLEADHVHTRTDPDPAVRKTHQLGDYAWWAGHGGIDGMRREKAKGLNWPCRFCHKLEPTNNTARKCDPATMPAGKSTGTPLEVKQYHAKWHAQIKYPKQQHVDARKRALGKCARCPRRVLQGQEYAFICDHRDPSTKMKGKDTLAGEYGGVAGLVNNDAVAASLDKIRDVLDNEMTLCDLLCANCDHRKTWGYPPRV